MLLIRALPPIPRAGRRPHQAARRFLLIETKAAPAFVTPPRFGRRRYVFDDMPIVTRPTAVLCAPARLEWNDPEFEAIRRAVGKQQAAEHALGNTPEEEADDHAQARLAHGLAWGECEALVHAVFTPEPQTIRDVFLRAEMLTMHFGRGGLNGLLEDTCPARRMLGGLLQACWKVGGAANV